MKKLVFMFVAVVAISFATTSCKKQAPAEAPAADTAQVDTADTVKADTADTVKTDTVKTDSVK